MRSRVNPFFELDPLAWVVSLVNTNPRQGVLRGHVAIVMEGIQGDGSLFFGVCELRTGPDAKDTILEFRCVFDPRLPGAPEPIEDGYPRDYNVETIRRHVLEKDYEVLPKRSWYVPPYKVEKMIASILEDAKALAQERANNQPASALSRYHVLGSHPIPFLGSVASENCVTWATRQLAVADIDDAASLLDSSAALPYLHTRAKRRGCILS